MIVVPGSRPSEQMRRINDLIRERLASDSGDEPIAFFCECVDASCFRSVWLTAAEYESACDDDWHPLTAEHGAAGWADTRARIY